MNEHSSRIRSKLLKHYYKRASLSWFDPKFLHWAKIVTQEGHWRWIRADGGIRGKLERNPPLHIYQTVVRFKTDQPPRGREASGFILGGPILFDLDLIPKKGPFSVWPIVDASNNIGELVDTMTDLGPWKLNRVTYSGFRGVHLEFTEPGDLCVPLHDESQRWKLRSLKRRRKQIGRSIGYWCSGWDWKVTADIWRVARVPESIHGTSSFRAFNLNPPYSRRHILEQMNQATVFANHRSLRVRAIRAVPPFTFVDGKTYGPYKKGWATKLPIRVALHLLWLGYAKQRESGPVQPELWFKKGWQMLFRSNQQSHHMATDDSEGVKCE